MDKAVQAELLVVVLLNVLLPMVEVPMMRTFRYNMWLG
jgi:hypothetical protein